MLCNESKIGLKHDFNSYLISGRKGEHVESIYLDLFRMFKNI